MYHHRKQRCKRVLTCVVQKIADFNGNWSKVVAWFEVLTFDVGNWQFYMIYVDKATIFNGEIWHEMSTKVIENDRISSSTEVNTLKCKYPEANHFQISAHLLAVFNFPSHHGVSFSLSWNRHRLISLRLFSDSTELL